MITIHGTGCCLMDYLYAACDFSSEYFKKAMSKKEADGGLSPGKLVFAEDFERFMGKPYNAALAEITGKPPDSHNLGGPSVVSLAHAAQILGDKAAVRYFGVRGNDKPADFVESALKKIPFNEYRLVRKDYPSPRTDVLSDPNYDNGHGERTFINLMGAANYFYPDDLDNDFFNADIVAFGATALLPQIHKNLTGLLKQAKETGAVTVANLVYDFQSDINSPGKKWNLGGKDDAYQYIDILIADKDEALKTSGCADSGGYSVRHAIQWFMSHGTGAVIVTDGSRGISLAAGKGIFSPLEFLSMPVCTEIDRELAAHPQRRGDTTGCGDNFAGGVIAGIAEQLCAAPGEALDLRECAIQGTAAGGFACFTIGGTYYEESPGEKRNKLEPYIEAYRRQLGKR
ncbi:MAG: carbohydrate kinase family protein [Treponema sp.]|nr:carbohydrate kinase family protein [Treponema sp.]